MSRESWWFHLMKAGLQFSLVVAKLIWLLWHRRKMIKKKEMQRDSKDKYVFCLRRSRIRKGRAREKTWTRDGQFSSRVRFNSTKLFWISRVMKIDHPEFTFFPNCEPWVNTASEQMRFLYEETIFKCWWGNNLFPGEIIYVPALTLHSTGNDQVNKLQKSLPGHT